MRIESSEDRIEGFCDVDGFRGEMSVIVFTCRLGRWTTGSSMCLPSQATAALQVLECYDAAANALLAALEENNDE